MPSGRPKSGTALSPAEKQRRYRARLAAKREAAAQRQVEADAATHLAYMRMHPRQLAQAIWDQRGRKAALAVRTAINKLIDADDARKAMVFDPELGEMVDKADTADRRRQREAEIAAFRRWRDGPPG